MLVFGGVGSRHPKGFPFQKKTVIGQSFATDRQADGSVLVDLRRIGGGRFERGFWWVFKKRVGNVGIQDAPPKATPPKK